MNSNRAIIHIDDDPQITRMVATRLKKYGYQVSPFNDPSQALKEMMCNQWRVILLDIDMPEINGLDLLREIKAYDGGIQVIILTGLVQMNVVLQSFQWGAEACIFKPVDDIEPLLTVLDDTFRKINRWWDTLEELSQRGRVECEALAV